MLKALCILVLPVLIVGCNGLTETFFDKPAGEVPGDRPAPDGEQTPVASDDNSARVPGSAETDVPPSPTQDTATSAAAQKQPTLTGTVIESYPAGRYTYVLLDTGEDKIWVAGPAREIQPGDEVVAVSPEFLMTNFYSRVLDRSFEQIRLVGSIELKGNGAQSASSPPEGEVPERHDPPLPAGND